MNKDLKKRKFGVLIFRSWEWRKLWKLREKARRMIFHIIGKVTFFWWDSWHPHGDLLQSYRRRIVYDSAISIDTETIVAAVIQDNDWKWPPARSEDLVQIQSVICGVLFPKQQEVDRVDSFSEWRV